MSLFSDTRVRLMFRTEDEDEESRQPTCTWTTLPLRASVRGQSRQQPKDQRGRGGRRLNRQRSRMYGPLVGRCLIIYRGAKPWKINIRISVYILEYFIVIYSV